MTEGKQRHGCLTAYLVVAIILLAIASLINLFAGGSTAYRQAYPSAPQWALPVQGLVGIFHIVCLTAIFRWKKWGFYGAAALCVVAVIMNLIIGVNIVLGLAGFISLAFLYGVLQIGGERKGWTQLE